MNHVALLLTREGRLNEGRKLMRGERALDQASARWSVETKKVE